MCGLSGFSGIYHPKTRYNLITSLGEGIDLRGGDSAGYVNFTGDRLNVGRKLGYWSDAQRSFIEKASRCKVAMMHSRYATCGKGDIKESHPFAIKRSGRIILYGSHNGMIFNAKDSAKKNDRKIVVDSEEIFHLIADKDWEGVRNLKGYGVVTWVSTDEPHTIYLLKLSKSGEVYIVRTEKNNVVYGSTYDIVEEALERCDIKKRYHFDIEVGNVYAIRDGNLWETDFPKCKIIEQKRIEPTYKWNSNKRYSKYSTNDYTNNYSNSDFLSGSRDSLDNWIELWKDAEYRHNESDIDSVVQGEFIDDSENDEFNLHCENCDNVIDHEEESELDMLKEEFLSKDLMDTDICMKCLGF